MNVIEQQAINKFGRIYRRTAKENELIFTCPKCNRDKLYVSTSTGVYHCFRCDFKGKIRNKPKLSEVIAKNNDNDCNKNKIITYLIPFNRQELTKEQRNALYKRGFTDDDINYYNITGGNRIQIPNFIKGNFTDLICFWEWRKEKVNSYNPKYLYTETIKKSDVLFNLYRIPENSDITLCEGVFNAMTAGKNAVASYGCSLSDNQLKLLLNNKPKSITIAYDSDDAGQKGAIKVINMLKNSKYEGDIYYILLPNGVDINDLGKEKYQDYLKTHKKLINLDSKLNCILPKILFELNN